MNVFTLLEATLAFLGSMYVSSVILFWRTWTKYMCCS